MTDKQKDEKAIKDNPEILYRDGGYEVKYGNTEARACYKKCLIPITIVWLAILGVELYYQSNM